MGKPSAQKHFFSILITLLCFHLSVYGTINILPLGNSITYDERVGEDRPVGDRIAYRWHLYQLLNGAGYDFDFVGSEQAGGNFLPPGYTDNGGFPGITNLKMLQKLKDGYLDNLNPDIILLEIGTNDLFNNDSATHFAGYLNSILDEIDNYESSFNKKVMVFLAQIINRAPDGKHRPTSNYNNLVADLVKNRPTDNIILVNMETGAGIDYRYYYDGGDMHDLYHPIESGYNKMAEKWFSALDPYLKSITNSPPVLSNIESNDLVYGGPGIVAVTSSLTVTDDDSPNLQSAVVGITAGYKGSEDVLSFDNKDGITGAWDAATGTLTLTGEATTAQYQSALRSIRYENTNTTNPSTAKRTVTFTVNDGTDDSNPVSRDITISAVNQAPALAALENTDLAYSEGAGKVAVTSSLTVTDDDSPNLQSAVAGITAGYKGTEDVLSFDNKDGITGAWDAATGTLTLTGEATTAQYQSALRSIRYENTNTTSPSTAKRTVTFTVNDGTDDSNPVSRDITISAVNQAPALADLENTDLAYSEGAGKVAVTTSITVTDDDSPNLQSAVVGITAGYKGTEDVLSFDNKDGITGAWDAATGTLTLTGEATTAQYQSALRSIRYENTNTTSPSTAKRTVTFTVNDGTDDSNPVSRDITISAVNQAPALAALENTDLAYSEGAGKVAVTSSLTVTDDDSPNLQSAVVGITAGYKGTEDILSFDNKDGITGAWDAATGTLTLTGEATTAQYQSALRSMRYENTNTTSPSTAKRTVTFTVNDGTDDSNPVSRDITMVLVNNAPALAGIETEAASYTEGSGKVQVTSTITISDPDNTTLQSAQIVISSGYSKDQDVLSFTGANSITGAWDAATGTLSLSGEATVAQYQDALRQVKYENTNVTQPAAGARTISFTVNDGAVNSNSVSRDITMVLVNNAPALAGIETEAASYTEGSGKIQVTSTITISDPDNTTLQSAQIVISSGYTKDQDVLSFTGANGITGAWKEADGTLSLTGEATVAQYQDALRQVKYENTNATQPAAGARTISFTVNDGAVNSNSVSRDMTMVLVNNAPALAGIETEAASYTEGSGKKQVTSTITISDPDNPTLQSAQIVISSGYTNGQDVLSFTGANGITGAWDAATGTLSLSGEATVAQYQDALRQVKYENTNATQPTAGARTISFTVNDGAVNSNSVSRNITMVLVNNAPALAGIETEAASYTEGSGKVQVTSNITISDPDNTTLQSAQIVISSGYSKDQDVLSFTGANGITGAWDAATGTLSLSGEATVAQFQDALRQVKYENTNVTQPAAGARTISFTVNDGAVNSNSVSRNITMVLVNNAPILGEIESTAISYNEGSGKSAITSAITIKDPDSNLIHSAEVRISTEYVSGQDILSFTDAGGISGSWNSAGGILTLSGEASLENYQNALRNIKYENTNIYNPTAGQRTITFEVNDGELASNKESRTITVIHINKAPVIANLESEDLIYLFPASPVNITNAITVSDIDNNLLNSATIQIAEGYKASEDLLSFSDSDNIKGNWDQATGTLVLTGSSSISNYQKALRNVKYSNLNNVTPSLNLRRISFSVSDGELSSTKQARGISFNGTPTAVDIRISGETTVCKTITGTYTYADPENDTESHTTFQWLRADTPDGTRTPVAGAVTASYTLNTEDEGKYLFFEVTPQAASGSIQGLPGISEPTIKIPNNLPGVTFSGSATICEGTTANITITLTGTPPFQLTYTDGLRQTVLNTSESVNQVPVTKAGVYKGILLKDNLNCDVTELPSSATIITKPSPHAEILNLNTAYSLRGAPVALNGTPSGGIFQGKGVVSTSNIFYPSLAGVEGSPHPITYTYVDQVTGCFDTDTVMVEILDAEASISGLRPNTQYCTVDVPAILTGSNVAGDTGKFAISGGIGLTDHGNNTATLDPTLLVPGNYTISYSYTQNNTPQAIYQDIHINRVDNVIISGFSNSGYCSGATPFRISSNYQSGIFEGSGIEHDGSSFTFNPGTAGTGINPVIMKYKNDLGCLITDTVMINIISSSRPQFEVNSNCWNSTGTVFNNTTVHPDSVTSWKWLFGDPPSSDNQSALSAPQHIYPAPGDYNVQLIATNLNNCTDTFSRTVHLGKKPWADMEWEKECTGESESLHINNTSTSDDSIKAYSWKITGSSGDTRMYHTEEITQKFAWHESYKVTLTLQTIYGCSDSITRNLLPGPPYSLRDSSYSETFEKGNSWNIEYAGNNNWTWQLPDGITPHSGTRAISTHFDTVRSSRQFVATSPCFDFTGIERPYIQLWINNVIEPDQEGAVLQYKTDSGSWTTLGTIGSGINWYNGNSVSTPSGNENGWTGNTNGWLKAANTLNELSGRKYVKFRMIYNPAPGGNPSNMFAFDDISIGERHRQSLFENFTNLSANSAFSSIQQLNTILSQSPKDVISLEYHASFPGSDSLNAGNTADPGARILHYGIGLIPYGILNGGSDSDLVYDFNSRKPKTNDILAQSLSQPMFDLAITTESNDGNINGKVVVTAGADIANMPVSLYTVVVEDITVQHEGNSVTLYNVVKKFLPSAGGTQLKQAWTRGEQVEVPFAWDYIKVYDPDKIKIVSFIQSDLTREVLQASANKITLIITSSPEVNEKPVTATPVIWPNPASQYARIVFPAPLKNDVKMELMNLNGKTIRNEVIFRNTDIYEFPVNDLINGLYLIRLTESNTKAVTLKLAVSR